MFVPNVGSAVAWDKAKSKALFTKLRNDEPLNKKSTTAKLTVAPGTICPGAQRRRGPGPGREGGERPGGPSGSAWPTSPRTPTSATRPAPWCATTRTRPRLPAPAAILGATGQEVAGLRHHRGRRRLDLRRREEGHRERVDLEHHARAHRRGRRPVADRRPELLGGGLLVDRLAGGEDRPGWPADAGGGSSPRRSGLSSSVSRINGGCAASLAPSIATNTRALATWVA